MNLFLDPRDKKILSDDETVELIEALEEENEIISSNFNLEFGANE